MNQGELLRVLRVLKADLERHGFEPWTEIEAEIWRGAKETLEKEDLEREKENLLPPFPKMNGKWAILIFVVLIVICNPIFF